MMSTAIVINDRDDHKAVLSGAGLWTVTRLPAAV